MALCDALEAHLTAARDLHAQFAAAAVHHLDMDESIAVTDLTDVSPSPEPNP